MVIDYRVYKLSILQIVVVSALYLMAGVIVGFLFYDSLIPVVLWLPGVFPVLKAFSKNRCEARKRKLNMEFKELLYLLSANMSAGYSLEKSFALAKDELSGMYQGKGYIQNEVDIILKGLEISVDVESLISSMAERSGIDDIAQWSDIVAVSKRSGGNLVKLMKQMAAGIDSRLEVEDEIDTMVTSKRFEQNIMCAMPFIIVLYLRICNPGYMDVLYQNIVGRVVMTVSLFVVAFVYMWGRRLVDIHV